MPGRRPRSRSCPGPGSLHNLHSFLLFDLTTSLGFDIPRAVTNAALVLVLGRPVLAALRRASRRAAFDAPVVHEQPASTGSDRAGEATGGGCKRPRTDRPGGARRLWRDLHSLSPPVHLDRPHVPVKEVAAVPLTYEEALAKVTGPGQLFEVVGSDCRRPDTSGCSSTLRPTWASCSPGPGGTSPSSWSTRTSGGPSHETMRNVDALAHALVTTYGISKGDRVGIAMRNLPEWIVSFAAILSIGAVSVSLNAWWTESELDYAIEDSGLALLIADPERIERAHAPAHSRGRADDHGPGRPARAQPDRGATATTRWSNLGDPMPAVEVGPDDDATILYTSGTTGFPKGAVSTHRAVINGLMASGATPPSRPPARERTRSAAGGSFAPCFILIVPAVPRHRVRAGDALLLRDEVQAGDDAPLGPRHGPPAHRGRAGHHLRRRAHPELGHAREPVVLQVRHVVAGQHRRRRCPGPGQAGRPGGEGIHPGPAQHRLRHDRDQRLRPGQHR